MKRCPVLIVLIAHITLITVTLCIPPAGYGRETVSTEVHRLEEKLEYATGKDKVDTLNLLGFHLHIREPGRAVGYLERSLEMAEKLLYLKGKAFALKYLANAERVRGEPRKPFRYAKEALNIYEKIGDLNGTIDALNTLGYLYRSIDNYDEAQKYLIRALEICEKVNLPLKKAGIQYQMGNLYLRLNDNNKAKEYFEQVLEQAKGYGHELLMTVSINNIGLAYRGLGEYHRALHYFKRALALAQKMKEPYKIASAYGNIGFIYGKLNQFDRALSYLRLAVETAQKHNNKKGICDNLIHIGNLYFKRKDYRQAELHYREALKIALDIEDSLDVKNIYKYLFDLYTARKDYKNAMDYFIKYTGIKDKLIDEKKTRQFLELQERYEAEKRIRDIEILKRNNKIETITRNVFIAGFVLVLAGLLFIFKKYLYLFTFWKKQKYIGQYRLMEVLGTGGMSTVYKAYSIRDKNRTVAVKILKDELSKRESNRRRFKLEGTIIDKLDHPNIIKIFERGQYQEKLFLVMEYVEGITLAETIETVTELGETINLDRCIEMMKQITAAIAFMHRANIIHRDLKPDNIMTTDLSDGKEIRVKLLDFGLSKMKFQSRITMTGMLVGTASYMAPEQITELESSPASDIFSLGIIYYQLLTGRAAFKGENLSQIENEIISSTPPVPSDIRPGLPEGLSSLVMEMLSKNPELRPPAETVAERLNFFTD